MLADTNRATQNEIDFVIKLGKHREGSYINAGNRVSVERLTIQSRINLLENYIKSMSRRSNWNRIDPEKVRAHAQDLIEALKKEL